MQLAALTRSDLIFPRVGGDDSTSVLRFFADRIADVCHLDAATLFDRLAEREQLSSTGIGGGVAVPHCRLNSIDEAILAVGLAPQGISFEATDGDPVRLFFVIVSPKSDPQVNLKLLSAIAHWVKEEGNVERILHLPTRPAILELLASSNGLGS